MNEYDIDPVLMGMASQKAEREDTTITPDLRGLSIHRYVLRHW